VFGDIGDSHRAYHYAVSARQASADVSWFGGAGRFLDPAGFAERLAGKPAKVIIVACMRKLLVILNAMLCHGTDWRTQAA
jgi:hypothetical protein